MIKTLQSDRGNLGWKTVTDAVHEAGGKIVLQLWHVGRASHSDFQPQGELPVSSSAIAIQGEIHTPQGKKPYETPRALEPSEIPGLIHGLDSTVCGGHPARPSSGL